ncbi:hypothetical protein H072_11569 [Dactylellina haptotyla CBS 200.50]|uniref:Uncharacterized protein n=1 Tax=Dactylellina haptotyla (strain CBS 200.50) TaxID=1284197 RepID=S8BIM2_DACHA|nr:hypothetical protein H072_11569 [Dactylellina haptotyla CBS 200.50]
MYFSGRPNQSRVIALAVVLLLTPWLYRFSEGRFFIPTRETNESWEQKTIDISEPTEIPSPTSKTQSSSNPTLPEQSMIKSPPVDWASKHHEKTIVIGKIKTEDATWVQTHLSDWRPAIYAVDDQDDTDYLHVSVNKGRESMPYLTYLIDYYDDLSDINIFLHAHEDGWPRAWHNEPQSENYSAVRMLQLLRLDNVRERGYVNLRCNGIPGCPGELHPNRKKFDKGAIEPGWKKLWFHMYGNTSYPTAVGVGCCAQFAVTRDKVREEPKEFYIKLMDWLLTTDSDDPSRVFEYFWHILFGMPLVHCETDYNACICRTYDCGADKKRSIDLFNNLA